MSPLLLLLLLSAATAIDCAANSPKDSSSESLPLIGKPSIDDISPIEAPQSSPETRVACLPLNDLPKEVLESKWNRKFNRRRHDPHYRKHANGYRPANISETEAHCSAGELYYEEYKDIKVRHWPTEVTAAVKLGCVNGEWYGYYANVTNARIVNSEGLSTARVACVDKFKGCRSLAVLPKTSLRKVFNHRREPEGAPNEVSGYMPATISATKATCKSGVLYFEDYTPSHWILPTNKVECVDGDWFAYEGDNPVRKMTDLKGASTTRVACADALATPSYTGDCRKLEFFPQIDMENHWDTYYKDKVMRAEGHGPAINSTNEAYCTGSRLYVESCSRFDSECETITAIDKKIECLNGEWYYPSGHTIYKNRNDTTGVACIERIRVGKYYLN